MKRILLLIFIIPLSIHAQSHKALEFFSLNDVRLLPGIFKEQEQTDINYILALNPDKLLAPFRREAGLPEKSGSYGNWESSGLDGHICGHYLSALAMMYASTGDKRMSGRLDYMIGELKLCQDKNANGYLGGVPGSRKLWEEVLEGNFADYKRKWVPFYNIHKVFAGLRDAYWYAGNKTAGEMLVRFADWFCEMTAKLSREQMQELLGNEHGGVNEVLADVYGITGNKKYLDAAYSFSHQAILQPLERDQDKLDNLHANTQIPKIIGFKRIADYSGDTAYNHAAEFFWQTVVHHRTIATGGNSVREHFNPSNDFSTMMSSVEGPESCNTYNMLKLTEDLYLSDPDVAYIDYYEKALYNHILTTQRPGKGGFVYFTPMRPGHYRVYSQPETSMWCCVGSGLENHAKYGKMIYTHSDNQLFVNLFIPSELKWKDKGLQVRQETAFPEQATTTLKIVSVNKNSFDLNIRYPSWVKEGALKVKINGASVAVNGKPSSYINLKRKWKKGDVITVETPMQTSTEALPDGSPYEAVLHGPILLAAVIDTLFQKSREADDSRMGHIAGGELYKMTDMPVFVSDAANDAAMIEEDKHAPMSFTAEKIIYPAKYKDLKLVPFYKIQDARYIVYWRKESSSGFAALQSKLAKEDSLEASLAANTIDVIAAGEQQPESDHAILHESSFAGVSFNRHWRSAREWFSYKLTDKNKTGKKIRVTYFGKEFNHKFSIWVNDRELAKVDLREGQSDTFYTLDYELPTDINYAEDGSMRIKFLADKGSIAGPVYEIRLLKK
ncbi:beta-L-arabinofuranosidase domain-containing protein [Chitinophaga sp. RCC_12]|uniref:beta-L-arabinofuranosidase domain-containing protein n=1 Tax=Chitinophaga sp. RCC_12 TaxID=3239226 RepID=UPI003524F135